jgi:hypothetical protein
MWALGHFATDTLLSLECISQNVHSQRHTLWRMACAELGITLHEEMDVDELKQIHRIASYFAGDAWSLEDKLQTRRFIERGKLAMAAEKQGLGHCMRLSFSSGSESGELAKLLEHLKPVAADCLCSSHEAEAHCELAVFRISPRKEAGATVELEGEAELSFYWEDRRLTCCVGVRLMPVHGFEFTVENLQFCETQHFSLFPIDHECPPGGIGIRDCDTKCVWDYCEANAEGHLEVSGTLKSVFQTLSSGKPVRAFLVHKGLSDSESSDQSSTNEGSGDDDDGAGE